MDQLQAQLEKLAEEFNKLQQDLTAAATSRQKLDSQKQENESVKKEVDKMKDTETIYKLVGPVLLKQEKFEVENTVKGRLEFISNEIERVEGQIKDIQKKMDAKRAEMMQIQAAAQQLAPKAGAQSEVSA